MNVLAFDTATEALGICLLTERESRTTIIKAGFKHSETLLPKINQLIDEAGIKPQKLDLIVCSLGPGSFTGVRIGLATARGLALGSGSPIVGVSSLDALAYRFRFFDGVVVPVLAALRKTRHYSALYQDGVRITDYLDQSLDDLVHRLKKYNKILLLTGPHVETLFKSLKQKQQNSNVHIVVDSSFSPTDPLGLLEAGLHLFESEGKGLKPRELSPLYLRKSEAEINLCGE